MGGLKIKKKIILFGLILIIGLFLSGCGNDGPENMLLVEAGNTSEDNGNITLDYHIEMGKYEVTHTEYIEFLNNAGVAADGSYNGKELIDMNDIECTIEHDGSSFYFAGSDRAESKDCPVIHVTWYGAVAYCNWLSEQEGLTPAYDLNNWELKYVPENLEGYRLPTEDEWEYTARGGVNGNPTTYAGDDNIDEVAWYWRNSGDELLDGDWDEDRIINNNCSTHPTGDKKANELGIYDMSGNVWEWTNTPEGSNRVMRGGSWFYYADFCEVNYRLYSFPSYSYYNIGFRLTKTK